MFLSPRVSPQSYRSDSYTGHHERKDGGTKGGLTYWFGMAGMKDALEKCLGERGRKVYLEVAERLSSKTNNPQLLMIYSFVRIGRLKGRLSSIPFQPP